MLKEKKVPKNKRPACTIAYPLVKGKKLIFRLNRALKEREVVIRPAPSVLIKYYSYPKASKTVWVMESKKIGPTTHAKVIGTYFKGPNGKWYKT